MITFLMLKKTPNGYEEMSIDEQLDMMWEQQLDDIREDNKLYNNPVQDALFMMEILNPSESYIQKGIEYIKENPVKYE